MPIKSVKLPIFVPLSKSDSYERVFIPFFRNAQIVEQRTTSLNYQWIIDSKETLIQFVAQGGKIRLIVECCVPDEEAGLIAASDPIATEAFLRRELLDPLKREIPYHEQWAIRYLYSLICQDIIDLRVALQLPNTGHRDPVIFLTENKDTILFHGGFFEPVKPDLMDVFVSWDQRDLLRINAYKQEFESQWKNKDNRSLTIALPKGLKREIADAKDSYNPYQYLLDNKLKYRMKPFQQDAIDRLSAQDWRGLFVLPIDSNQNLLALFALDQFILTEPRTVAMVVVPNRHALGEWEGLIKSKYPEKVVYSFTSVDEAKNSDLSDRIRVKLREDFIVVLVTYQLFASLGFQTILRRNKNKTFYVFDECFLLCQRQWTDLCPLAPDSARIGLTSTPTKWLSEGNEKRLQEHFGSVVWEVMLSDLLGESLTDYHYQAHLSELIISEYSQYKQLTHLIHTAKKDIAGFDSLPDKIIQYLDQREAILESAYNKAGDFINFYHAHGEKRAIVYVGVDQIDSMKERMEFEFHLKIEAFKPEMPMAQRLRLIKGFLAEQIDLLITAEAFNEGLDSLKPKAIYLLSSPGSPRVFFQRRNLILTAPGDKKKPIIHDFVTIAPREGLLDSKQKEIVIRELPRVMELSRLAGKSELTELMEYLASCDLAHEFGEADPVKINRELYLKDEPYLE